MSNRTIELGDELYGYLIENSLREPELRRRLRDETSKLEMARMQIAPEQGQFMALLIQLSGARRVLEIGTFTGYSTLCMAEALPDDGLVIACDTSAEWTSIASRYWREAGVAKKIDLRLAPAAQTLEGLLRSRQAGAFDFAFIDADKESYELYFELCLELVREGGLIVIDNVLWGGKVADPVVADVETEALRSLNCKLHFDSRIDLSLVPIGDGLTLCRKR